MRPDCCRNTPGTETPRRVHGTPPRWCRAGSRRGCILSFSGSLRHRDEGLVVVQRDVDATIVRANQLRVCGSAVRCASPGPAATDRRRTIHPTTATARIDISTDLRLPLGRHRSMLGPLISRESKMIYELRVYHCVPGRLPDLIKR